MDIITQLINELTNVGFENKIKSNIATIHDILLAKTDDLIPLKRTIEELILFKKKLIKSLNFDIPENRIFLQMLLYLAIKLRLKSSLKCLFDIAKQTDIQLPLRLKVAVLYLGQYHYVNEIIDNFDEIINLINNNSEEEDDSRELTCMVVHYFIYVLYNYTSSNISEVKRLQDKFYTSKKLGKYDFLENDIIDYIINCNVSNHENVYRDLIERLDMYMQCRKLVYNYNDYLIEDIGDYYNEFVINPSFSNIMKIAQFENPGVYNELGRGVSILDSQSQMLQYLYSFGRMHEAKLNSAFSTIDLEILNRNKIEIIDWGCGQGIASVLFNEYLSKNNCYPIIDKVTLIEPSEICIKRAALHVREIIKPSKILTLNTTLDDLLYNKINTSNDSIKVHLFSNILDVEAFSLDTLINGIKNYFEGDNYFICVSPYINDLKTNRLDVFMNSLVNSSFKLYRKENISDEYWSCSRNYHDNKCFNHPTNGCNKKWRKALRTFYVNL